ncbi:MAG: YceI family protein [Reichenbachiella sp.]
MKFTITIGLLFIIIYSTNAFSHVEIAPTSEYDVDRNNSSLKWIGYHLGKSYEHWGNIKIKSGFLDIQDDEIHSGSIVIDMKSITVGDVEKAESNKKLVDHLKSEEFFFTKKHSTAMLSIKESDLSESGGSTLIADITIRGITKEISFDVFLKDQTDSQFIFVAEIIIDRSAHEVLYGWSIDNAMISGEFKLEAEIVVKK